LCSFEAYLNINQRLFKISKKEEKPNCDFFGFLPYQDEIKFDGGIISPVDDYEINFKLIDEYTHEDGFLYPPVSQKYIVNPKTMKPQMAIPKTERPAHLHKLPASHMIQFNHKEKNIRHGVGAFIIHLLAYLFGTRLQFCDWWFDGRIPIKSTHNIFFANDTLIKFLSHSYKIWQEWKNEEIRRKFINVLYMHSRAPSYKWDWESFMIEYMVFDGCYKLTELLYNIKSKNHKERFNIIINKFGILNNETIIDNFRLLRNDLFHEALWDKSLPCTANTTSAFMAQYHLRRFNQRLIAALLNYNTTYIQTIWWSLGNIIFEPTI